VKTLDNGLIVDEKTSTIQGYLFNFEGRGAFAPGGKVGGLTAEQIHRHNTALASLELEAMKREGRGILYLCEHNDSGTRGCVSQWAGGFRQPIYWSKRSRHFVPGCPHEVWRRDVWFSLEGESWHGVNIGDNEILRCHRLKGGAK
jgi:hypothetical protein